LSHSANPVIFLKKKCKVITGKYVCFKRHLPLSM
jgi:hypothetical protein